MRLVCGLNGQSDDGKQPKLWRRMTRKVHVLLTTVTIGYGAECCVGVWKV